jgi:hypothetical protein
MLSVELLILRLGLACSEWSNDEEDDASNSVANFPDGWGDCEVEIKEWACFRNKTAELSTMAIPRVRLSVMTQTLMDSSER